MIIGRLLLLRRLVLSQSNRAAVVRSGHTKFAWVETAKYPLAVSISIRKTIWQLNYLDLESVAQTKK